jgi:hypothetical protein
LRRSSSVSRSRLSIAASSPLPSLAEQEAVAAVATTTDRRQSRSVVAAGDVNNRSATTTNDTASLASRSVSIDLSTENAMHGIGGGGGSDSLSLDSHRVYRRGGSHDNSHHGLVDPLCVSTPKSNASRSIRRHQHQHPPLRQRGSRDRAVSPGRDQRRDGGPVPQPPPAEKQQGERRKSLDMRSGSSDLSENEKRGTLTSLSSTSTSTASPPSTCSTASPPSSTASPPSRYERRGEREGRGTIERGEEQGCTLDRMLGSSKF